MITHQEAEFEHQQDRERTRPQNHKTTNMKPLGAYLLLLAVTLAGQASAWQYCCEPGCEYCNYHKCGEYDVCRGPLVSRDTAPRPPS